MAHTRLLLGDAARGKVLAGATLLDDAVRVTPSATPTETPEKKDAPRPGGREFE